MEQIPITVYSSLLFFVNYLNAFYNEYNIYALLFLGLTISSVLHHLSFKEAEVEVEVELKKEISIPNKAIEIIDKILCYLIIFYGGYMLATKMQTLIEENETVTLKKIGLILIILGTFFATIFLFCSPDKYSFCTDPEEALCWHAFLHFIASIGHHCIIFL
jgi:hypothetical protein